MDIRWQITDCYDYEVGRAGPYEGQSRVIYTVYWTCQAQETGADGQPYIGSIGDATLLEPFEGGGEITPYDEVTEAMVLEWLKSRLRAEEVVTSDGRTINREEHTEERVTASLEGKLNDVAAANRINKGRPWRR